MKTNLIWRSNNSLVYMFHPRIIIFCFHIFNFLNQLTINIIQQILYIQWFCYSHTGILMYIYVMHICIYKLIFDIKNICFMTIQTINYYIILFTRLFIYLFINKFTYIGIEFHKSRLFFDGMISRLKLSMQFWSRIVLPI